MAAFKFKNVFLSVCVVIVAVVQIVQSMNCSDIQWRTFKEVTVGLRKLSWSDANICCAKEGSELVDLSTESGRRIFNGIGVRFEDQNEYLKEDWVTESCKIVLKDGTLFSKNCDKTSYPVCIHNKLQVITTMRSFHVTFHNDEEHLYSTISPTLLTVETKPLAVARGLLPLPKPLETPEQIDSEEVEWTDPTPINPNLFPMFRGYQWSNKMETNWYDAKTNCASSKMELVSILTQKDYNRVLAAMKSIAEWKMFLKSKNGVFLSATEIPGTRQFRWYSGENNVPHPLNEFDITKRLWAPGQPNNANKPEQCVSLYLRNATNPRLAMEDIRCVALRRFMCQKITPIKNSPDPIV